MSIFKTILSKIFPGQHPANKPAGSDNAAGTGTGSGTGASAGAGTPSGAGMPAAAPQGAASAPPAAAAGGMAASAVDVDAVLGDMQAKHPEKLNWKTSIVDLLKLLGLDSSLPARRQLAGELGYTGNTDDSAAMNIWLHKEVMRKLAENGGKLPADLKH